MFVILEGQGDYRFGESRYRVEAGDVLGAPRGGPEFAHQLINTGAGALKYLAISSVSDADVCEYPDSGKFGAGSRTGFRIIGRRGESLDYLGWGTGRVEVDDFGRDGVALVVLLGGGTKARQQRDIEAAQNLWREYRQSRRREG